MNLQIRLYLNDKSKTLIDFFINPSTNPFKVGDIILLSLERETPEILNSYALTKNYKKFKETVHEKQVIIVKETKSISINMSGESTTIIDYYCDLVENE